MAVKGSNEERIAAATILCGASLIRGWNIQVEHTVYFITRLLSPPVPVDYIGNESHLISYAPMLNVLLVGIAPVDCVQIFSLHEKSAGNQTVTTVTSGSSSSSGPGSEIYLRPKLPAWDILEAVPFVADAALTACSHGRLSPRELCTGLKDLADFLPATLATIVSYFSAEVTRGVWKSVFMNGTDWPSPAANLSNVEGQIKKILAATGVDIPSLATGGSSPASLPLPLAAFVSLTITYKLDKASQRFLDLAGPALESLAAGCPWPCMPIVASLWTQKAKRWSDFLVFSASRTVFLHSNDAVVQLLRSCFSATLGLNSSCCIKQWWHWSTSWSWIWISFQWWYAPVAPGSYICESTDQLETSFLREEIVSVLMQTVEDVAWLPSKQSLEKLKKSKNGMKHGHASLAAL
ncbi:UNVERIFIED_CONTAM: Mediator of RNA polymerase II transcription subunitA [Sesamum radiatum]|uniref:Mediator of RNA polymerase II transcription subunitA n=1 Tax=Sesamum radiatum TaxID=300843 RepID=A0AAW2UBE3_SESRA